MIIHCDCCYQENHELLNETYRHHRSRRWSNPICFLENINVMLQIIPKIIFMGRPLLYPRALRLGNIGKITRRLTHNSFKNGLGPFSVYCVSQQSLFTKCERAIFTVRNWQWVVQDLRRFTTILCNSTIHSLQQTMISFANCKKSLAHVTFNP